MGRLPLTGLVLVLALTGGAVATFAKSNGGKVDNVAATRAYLLAWHKSMFSASAISKPVKPRSKRLVASVKSECSGVLSAAPDNRGRQDVRDEVLEDVALTQERPARGATLAFARTVERLHWSNRKLTYYVSHSAREEAAKEQIALPNICADARSLAADGFKAAPATTEKFLASCGAANSITTIELRPGETGSLDERIWRLLKPYERPDEKALIPHKPTKQELERAAPVLEKAFGTPVYEIAHALGLPE